jgi:hypothetical protein
VSGALAIVVTGVAAITAVFVYYLQLHLENWDYERHVDD